MRREKHCLEFKTAQFVAIFVGANAVAALLLGVLTWAVAAIVVRVRRRNVATRER